MGRSAGEPAAAWKAAPHAKHIQFRRKHRTGLVTLVFTDLVDSVALRRQLGDQAGTSLLQAHRQLVRQTVARFADAEEIKTAGDSLLAMFELWAVVKLTLRGRCNSA